MPDRTPYREQLRRLRERAELSGNFLAEKLGFSSGAGYYRYEQERTQADRPIPQKLVNQLIPLMRGRGKPPITIDELLALSGIGTAGEAVKSRAVERATEVATVVEFKRATQGGQVVPLRYRIEAGSFHVHDPKKVVGVSMIGVSPEYPMTEQFAAILVDADGTYARGTQLHCVPLSEYPHPPPSTPVVVATPYETSSLVAYRVGKAGLVAQNETVVGVVIGVYAKV